MTVEFVPSLTRMEISVFESLTITACSRPPSRERADAELKRGGVTTHKMRERERRSGQTADAPVSAEEEAHCLHGAQWRLGKKLHFVIKIKLRRSIDTSVQRYP